MTYGMHHVDQRPVLMFLLQLMLGGVYQNRRLSAYRKIIGGSQNIDNRY
jgi:hypothetical protein